MTDNEHNEQTTIEQLQALASEILKGLAETRQLSESNAKAIKALTDSNAKAIEDLAAKTRQVTDSNARAIEALANAATEERKDREKSERRLNTAMARMSDAIAQMSGVLGQIGSAQAMFWEVQADYYRRLEEVDERQATMVEILNRLTQNNNS